MLDPKPLLDSLFYESLCFTFSLSSQVNRVNFENSFRMLSTALVSLHGQGIFV